MWRLCLPPKVNHFFRCLCTNVLPNMDMLRSWKVAVSADCVMCNNVVESNSHIFLELVLGDAQLLGQVEYACCFTK